jgi:AraC family transcriptional regulator, regulatory protein of adaptative response / methylated-DNA-[protein]-cysteine methyltransferase
METMPDHYQYDQMARAIEYLYQHFREQPSLEEAAAQVNMSVFHFQRTFTEWAGISPKRFLQFLTTGYLKEHLVDFENLPDAADAAGLSSQSRVYDLFVNLEAVTPQEYKEKGAGLLIDYGFHTTPFGECIIGVTERGVCYLSFVQPNQKKQAVQELQQAWEYASLQQNQQQTSRVASLVFNKPAIPAQKLNVLVKGTNFQVKVWNALLQIPPGSVTTYQSIAQHIAQPNALQAVGSAIGANSIAYLIPCHRVIRKNLVLADYRWGTERKKVILGWEMAKAAI